MQTPGHIYQAGLSPGDIGSRGSRLQEVPDPSHLDAIKVNRLPDCYYSNAKEDWHVLSSLISWKEFHSPCHCHG
uniref:Uncharacterized protein n=1 Tax=Setaria italica TaxID=4555 RepID=K3ZYQ2_SETIT